MSELPSPSPPRKPWWHRAFVLVFDCTPSELVLGAGCLFLAAIFYWIDPFSLLWVPLGWFLCSIFGRRP